jgi:hypothetical protein
MTRFTTPVGNESNLLLTSFETGIPQTLINYAEKCRDGIGMLNEAKESTSIREFSTLGILRHVRWVLSDHNTNFLYLSTQVENIQKKNINDKEFIDIVQMNVDQIINDLKAAEVSLRKSGIFIDAL